MPKNHLRPIAHLLAGALAFSCGGELPDNGIEAELGAPGDASGFATLSDYEEDTGSGSSQALTCAQPQMSVFPVDAAHNIGWDRRSCGSGRCAVSCPDQNANSDWSRDDHQGIDVFAHRRAPMVAVADGVIQRVGVVSRTSGLRVRLRDNCGWEYYYGHLDEAVVSQGQRVRAGQLIGYMGNTGTGGVHLHFNISPDGRYNSDINPFDLLNRTSATACLAAPPPPSQVPAVSDAVLFDAVFYVALHDDLRAAFGTNVWLAARHWLDHGIREGRRASPEFDARFYLASNPDVARAYGGANYQGAIDHFLQYGAREGRAGSREVNPRDYLSRHADLRAAFGATNFPAALNHYRAYGMREGRRASTTFDPKAYLGRYADLRSAFGTDYRLALAHWIHYGIQEGRNPLP